MRDQEVVNKREAEMVGPFFLPTEDFFSHCFLWLSPTCVVNFGWTKPFKQAKTHEPYHSSDRKVASISRPRPDLTFTRPPTIPQMNIWVAVGEKKFY